MTNASWEKTKIALTNPTKCMDIANRIRAGPTQDGELKLLSSAWRRVQISHTETTGIKKPWLYSGCTAQRLPNSESAPRNETTANKPTRQPQIQVGIREWEIANIKRSGVTTKRNQYEGCKWPWQMRSLDMRGAEMSALALM